MQDAAHEYVQKVPALGLSLQVQLSPKCTLVFQSHVDAIESPNALLDRMVNAADRLAARYELKEKRVLLEQNEVGLRHMVEDLNRIHARNRAAHDASGKRGDYKPTNAEKTDLEKINIGKERTQQRIDAMKLEIAQLEKDAQ